LKNSGLSTNNTLRQWTAITGYAKGNNDIVYAGVNNLGGNANGAKYSSIWRTVNNGNDWVPLVDANTNVSDIIYGQSYEWWYRTDAFPQAGLGRTNSVVSSIDVARGPFPNVASDDIIYVSGRGGIWKSDDGGDFWKPAVYNMQVTSNNDVAVNPNNSSQVAIANTDFVPNGAESKGYDVIFDAIANELIVGVGDRDTNSPGGGEVYVKSATAHNGTWSKSSGINIGSTKRSNFIWPDNGNSGVVYLLDLLAGLYRSTDGGRNWTNIWPGMSFNNKDFFNAGYITADDNNPTTVYLSIQGRGGSPIGTRFRVFRMTGAAAGKFDEPDNDSDITDITLHSGNLPIQRPGPIVFGADGKLWLTHYR